MKIDKNGTNKAKSINYFHPHFMIVVCCYIIQNLSPMKKFPRVLGKLNWPQPTRG